MGQWALNPKPIVIGLFAPMLEFCKIGRTVTSVSVSNTWTCAVLDDSDMADFDTQSLVFLGVARRLGFMI